MDINKNYEQISKVLKQDRERLIASFDDFPVIEFMRRHTRILDTYFQIQYSDNRLQAFLKVNREIPDTMTSMNITLWLYQKKVTNGVLSSAIQALLDNSIKPGEKIMVAQGKAAIPEKLTPKILFKRGLGQVCPPVVRKGESLINLTRKQGQSGVNVNHCIIPSPKSNIPVIAGENVIRSNNKYIAACDGVPELSDQAVVSVSQLIVIPGNLSSNDPVIDHDCDVHVSGTVYSGVRMKCRYLTATGFEGEVQAFGDVLDALGRRIERGHDRGLCRLGAIG